MEDILSDTLRTLRVGDPVSHGPLHLFPLLGGPPVEEGILLLDEALEDGSLRVEEVEGASRSFASRAGVRTRF